MFEGPGGLNAKGREPGQASYYYSMTRMLTGGTLTVNGKAYTVEGVTWMDHEFSSNALAKNQSGWDWMGLHLDDGGELMIYRMRDTSGGSDYLSGTRVEPDGRVRYLAADEIQLGGSKPWKSPTSGAAYPQEWALRVKGLPNLIVRSAMPGQELVTSGSADIAYFEGAAEITDESGKPAGTGYLEMTGYSKSMGGSF